MFVINFLGDMIQISMLQYLFGACGFYGLFMCIRKVIYK